MGKESIVKKAKCCFFCGAESQLDRHHIFGASNRKFSEEDGLWVWICHLQHVTTGEPESVHNRPNHGKDRFLKMAGELAWIKEYANVDDIDASIELFSKRYGRNYL